MHIKPNHHPFHTNRRTNTFGLSKTLTRGGEISEDSSDIEILECDEDDDIEILEPGAGRRDMRAEWLQRSPAELAVLATRPQCQPQVRAVWQPLMIVMFSLGWSGLGPECRGAG